MTHGQKLKAYLVCAFFHTHTPLTYCPEEVRRKTGPSKSDISFAEEYGIPGLLYDYSASYIYGGEEKDAQAKIYTFGPTQKNSKNININQ